MIDYRPIHSTLKGLCDELVQKNWITSKRVYDVMMKIDRADFASRHPYENNQQPIPCNTVISAPLLHAYSLEALKDFLKPGNKVLDVGSGSGYLTLAMSKMMNDQGCVIGIDHMKELIDFGIQNISKHHKNLIDKKSIKFIFGDGNNGCIQEAPFDCIHVGAVAEKPPEALLRQLKVGGRMIMPLHNKGNQFIYIIDKKSDNFEVQEGLSVCYSPLTTVYEQLNNVKIKSEEKDKDQSKKETQKEKNKDPKLKEENKKLIEENIVLRETIDTLRKENKNLQQKLSGENNNLKETINSLKQENKNLAQKLNKEIIKLKEKIKSLENEIINKNKEIQNLLSKNNNEYNHLNLNENAISTIKPGEKIIAVNFRSMGSHEIVNYCLPCKNTDLFIRLEEKLYNDYPNLKDYETYFEVDTRRIKRFKTIDENNIKGNDIISLFVIEE